ncbi:MAG TPA: MFS transporter [bacterium]|nr:MFS transporter [bacterium]
MLFRALRSRNYRLYFIGHGLSLIGTWMHSIALQWLVYRLTGSARLLGVVTFSTQICGLVLAPFAGVIVERMDRRRLLMVTQSLAMTLALMLATLVFTETIAVWHIIVFSICLGSVNAFDITARQSFVVHMVEGKEDLANAIALNSMMFNGARFLGPAVAGVLIAKVGEGFCFLINAISYISILIALALMRVQPWEHVRGKRLWDDLVEGFEYAFHFQSLRTVFTLLALVSLFALPYTVLLPIFANDILQGGAKGYGWLVSSIGVGALCGAVFLASRKTVVGLEKVIAHGPLLLGLAMISFSWSRMIFLSMGILLFMGFGMMVHMASCNTVVQTIVDEKMRSRVMSIHMMTWTGLAPFGGLLVGDMAERTSPPITLTVAGVVCILGFLFFRKRMLQQRHVIETAFASHKTESVLPQMPNRVG